MGGEVGKREWKKRREEKKEKRSKQNKVLGGHPDIDPNHNRINLSGNSSAENNEPRLVVEVQVTLQDPVLRVPITYFSRHLSLSVA